MLTQIRLIKCRHQQDIKDGDYKVALGPLTGGNAQAAFIASAYAFGGDMNNLDPAFEFWTELAKEGRINTLDITQANFESGEISVGVVWSFTGIPYSKNISQYKMQAVVPSDGAYRMVTLPLSTNMHLIQMQQL